MEKLKELLLKLKLMHSEKTEIYSQQEESFHFGRFILSFIGYAFLISSMVTFFYEDIANASALVKTSLLGLLNLSSLGGLAFLYKREKLFFSNIMASLQTIIIPVTLYLLNDIHGFGLNNCEILGTSFLLALPLVFFTYTKLILLFHLLYFLNFGYLVFENSLNFNELYTNLGIFSLLYLISKGVNLLDKEKKYATEKKVFNVFVYILALGYGLILSQLHLSYVLISAPSAAIFSIPIAIALWSLYKEGYLNEMLVYGIFLAIVVINNFLGIESNFIEFILISIYYVGVSLVSIRVNSSNLLAVGLTIILLNLSCYVSLNLLTSSSAIQAITGVSFLALVTMFRRKDKMMRTLRDKLNY